MKTISSIGRRLSFQITAVQFLKKSGHEIDPVEVPANFMHMKNRAEDIAAVRGMGMMVDDDNDPAPENVPADEIEKGEQKKKS